MEALKNAPIDQQTGRVERGIKIAGTIFQGVIEAGKTVVTLPFACGYVHSGGLRREVHDHDGKKRVHLGIFRRGDEDYNPEKHGPLKDWVVEGQKLNNLSEAAGKQPIHRHDSNDTLGPYEYRYE